jgi:hypothetical protein
MHLPKKKHLMKKKHMLKNKHLPKKKRMSKKKTSPSTLTISPKNMIVMCSNGTSLRFK